MNLPNLPPGVDSSEIDKPQPLCPGCGQEYSGENELCDDCRKEDLENEGKRE